VRDGQEVFTISGMRWVFAFVLILVVSVAAQQTTRYETNVSPRENEDLAARARWRLLSQRRNMLSTQSGSSTIAVVTYTTCTPIPM